MVNEVLVEWVVEGWCDLTSQEGRQYKGNPGTHWFQ